MKKEAKIQRITKLVESWLCLLSGISRPEFTAAWNLEVNISKREDSGRHLWFSLNEWTKGFLILRVWESPRILAGFSFPLFSWTPIPKQSTAAEAVVAARTSRKLKVWERITCGPKSVGGRNFCCCFSLFSFLLNNCSCRKSEADREKKKNYNFSAKGPTKGVAKKWKLLRRSLVGIHFLRQLFQLFVYELLFSTP